jgi:hypothetical protein
MPPPLPRSRSTTVAVGSRTVKGVAVVTCVDPLILAAREQLPRQPRPPYRTITGQAPRLV